MCLHWHLEVWDDSRVSPSRERQPVPPRRHLSICTEGQCRRATALQLRLRWDTPMLPTGPSLPPPGLPCCSKRVWFWMNLCFLSWVSLCYVFLFVYFSSWREALREGVVSQPFLSYHNDLWLYYFFMGYSLPTAASLFELTGLKPSVVWLHLKSVQNHQGWIWTMYLFVMLQLVALVMIIMCHKENILSLCAEQTAGTL